MSTSFDLDNVDAFICGCEGPPGARVFFLQATGENYVVTLRCEKQHVSVLADYLEGIIGIMDHDGDAEPMGELVTPVIAEWVVGAIMVGVDPSESQVIVIAEEFGDDTTATAKFTLTTEQVASFIDGARQLVAAGRPTCEFCNRPYIPGQHVCPAMN